VDQGRPTVLSVVIPTYNEADNIPNLLSALAQVGEQVKPVQLEIILVDDCSTDNTFQVASALTSQYPNLSIIRLVRNYGSHGALAAGFRAATGDCAAFIAGDFQDPPELLVEMLESWRKGNKIVWAARTVVMGQAPLNAFLSQCYWNVFNWAASYPVERVGIDFVLMDRAALDILKAQSHLAIPIFAQISGTGFPYSVIRYQKPPRAAGQSKWTLKMKLLLVLQTLTFSQRPYRSLSIAAMIMWLAGLVFWLCYLFMTMGLTWPSIIAAVGVICLHATLIIQCMLALLMMEFLNARLNVANVPRVHVGKVVPAKGDGG
jgi:dolichol-phosphate mannosyltransferase